MATSTPGSLLAAAPGEAVSVARLCDGATVNEVLDELDGALIGLAPVKARVREIAALLLVDRARRQVGLASGPPTLHMCFTGNPGTGKTTVALRMAEVFYRLGYVQRGHVVAVTRDDLVGQYVGHTAPRTKDAVKRALGGVLFIDEAYALHRPENERDYGGEAIEILLQAMETHRHDLVVILAGYRDRMERFLECNPGFSSRIAHHLEFPDYADAELLAIADRMLEQLQYRLSPDGRRALEEYVARRRRQPRFANGRSIRNALDRARLRHASRLVRAMDVELGRDELMTIEAEDIRRSRVFADAPAAKDAGVQHLASCPREHGIGEDRP